jgi:hypothetical protein
MQSNAMTAAIYVRAEEPRQISVIANAADENRPTVAILVSSWFC